MKKYTKVLIIFSLFLTLGVNLFADNFVNSSISEFKEDDYIQIDERTGFPVIKDKPFVVFDYGAASSWVTRIVKQTGRSNFVFTDTLVGAYVNMRTVNMAPLDSMIRLSVFYPIAYKFNKVPQAAVNMLNFGVDLFAAPVIKLNLWNYVTFDLGAGLHCLYEQGDRWHYLDLGVGGIARINMPVARHWSVFLDGLFSIDYGNLGTNGRMEPYDFVWQYQISFGFRYSRRAPNKYSYIPSRIPFEDELQMMKEKEIEKDKRKQAKRNR